MIVVSDISCLSNLIAINRIFLLREMFGTVIIPPPVRAELNTHPLSLPDYLETRAPSGRAAVASLLAAPLHRGEAIALAEELCADYLLIDQTAGRTVAEVRGLRHIGLHGLLRRAKEQGRIAEVRPELDAPMAAGFWIAANLRARYLHDLGEA